MSIKAIDRCIIAALIIAGALIGMAAVTINRDHKLIAGVIYAESRGEGKSGMMAVASVIKMRAYLWGESPADIVKSKHQFAKPLYPDDKGPEWNFCMKLAIDLVKEDFVPTIVATHFHSKDVYPSWADSPQMSYICTIGNHIFYYENR